MRGNKIGPGCFVAVVGPSGAGKDTILRGARERLANDGTFVFPRRAITRPEGDDNEIHDAMSVSTFRDAEAAGAFCLSWEAHGLCYGIPVSVADAVGAGRIVVANLSRAALFNMRAIFMSTRVMSIQVSANVVRQRLLNRGRESTAGIEARIDRMQRYAVEGKDVFFIDNSGPPELAIKAITGQLLDLKTEIPISPI